MIYCTYCGEVLPAKDARFCRNCGMLVPSHPLSFQSLTAAKGASSPTRSSVPLFSESEEPTPQKQGADQLPAHPSRQREQREKESSADKLDSRGGESQKALSLGSFEEVRADEELGVGKSLVDQMVTQHSEEFLEEDEGIEDTPAQEENDDIGDILMQEENDDIEDIPTQLLRAQKQEKVDEHREEIALQETMVLSLPQEQETANEQRKEIALQETIGLPSLEHIEVVEPVLQAPVSPGAEASRQSVDPVLSGSQAISPRPEEMLPQSVQESVGVSSPVLSGQASEVKKTAVQRDKRRFPLAVVMIVCIVFLLGGTGAWVIVFQPFSVSAVTNPLQAFKDASLGVSLRYPTEWVAQVDRKASLVRFHDSSQTSQATLFVKIHNAGDINRYMQKQEIGMTSVKQGPPVSFAGASWQQVQGTVQESGANYTETIFITMRGDQLIMFVQQAYQSVYAQEDKLVFSPMRSSLKIF